MGTRKAPEEVWVDRQTTRWKAQRTLTQMRARNDDRVSRSFAKRFMKMHVSKEKDEALEPHEFDTVEVPRDVYDHWRFRCRREGCGGNYTSDNTSPCLTCGLTRDEKL